MPKIETRQCSPPKALSCDEIADLVGPLIEGELALLTSLHLMEHTQACADCAQHVRQFRLFLESGSEPMVLPVTPLQAPAEPSSPSQARWQARLSRWLDDLYPATVPAPIYRGKELPLEPGSEWEMHARGQAEQAYRLVCNGDVQLTLHVARGRMFGRVTDLDDEPLFPVLLNLAGDPASKPMVSQPDGTFELRWNPEASHLDCQLATGKIVRFPV